MLRAQTDPRGRSANRDRLHSGYATHARGGENSTSGSRDAPPHRGPARRQPFLSGADQGVLTGSTKSLVLAYCRQPCFLLVATCFAGTYVLAFFWDFAASGAGRRRPDRHCDRMDFAQARDDEKQGAQKTVRPQDTIRRAFYPLDIATDRRPWINLRSNHVGCERGSPLRISSFDNLGRIHWIGADRDQHFVLPWVCRPVGANPGSNGDDVITQLSSLFLVCIGARRANPRLPSAFHRKHNVPHGAGNRRRVRARIILSQTPPQLQLAV
jgi:hypothetical protein